MKKNKTLLIVGIILGSIISILLCFFLVIYIYMNYFQINKPEDTITKLETAMNELDQTDLLECFDDDVNHLYAGMMSLGEEYSGINLSGLTDLAEGLGGIVSSTELTPLVKITIQNIDYIDDRNCIVYVTLTSTYQGHSSKEETTLPMKIQNRTWVITMDGYNAIK